MHRSCPLVPANGISKSPGHLKIPNLNSKLRGNICFKYSRFEEKDSNIQIIFGLKNCRIQIRIFEIRGKDSNPNPNNLFISDLEDLEDPARGLWIPALRPAPPARWVVILPKNAINLLLLFSVQELHQKQYFRQLKLLRFSSLFGKQRKIITHAAPRCGCSSHVWPAAADGAAINNTMMIIQSW